MVFCAHPDDEVLGAGGTIAKYAREGKKVIAVIFSYGESSHPWMKKKIHDKNKSQRINQSRKDIRLQKNNIFRAQRRKPKKRNAEAKNKEDNRKHNKKIQSNKNIHSQPQRHAIQRPQSSQRSSHQNNRQDTPKSRRVHIQHMEHNKPERKRPAKTHN